MPDDSGVPGPRISTCFSFWTSVLAGLVLLSLSLPVRAEIDVTVSGVSGEMKDNVELRLRIREAAARKDLDQALVDALHQRAETDIQTALQPFGYYRPVVQSSLQGQAPRWRAQYRIDPGPRTRVRTLDLQIEGEGMQDMEREQRRIRRRLDVGEALLHSRYEEAKALLTGSAYRAGYMDARYTRSELRVYPEQDAADVVLRFDTGPRYYFGEVTVQQQESDGRVRDDVIARYIAIEPGEPYDPQRLLDTQFALGDLGYFDAIEPQPQRELAGPDRHVPIVIRTTPRAPRRYSTGVGYGTDTGARISGAAEFRRLNDAGHKVLIDTRLSEVKNTARGEYRIPQGRKPGEQVAVAAELAHEQYDAGDSLKYGVELSMSRTPGAWQRRLYLAFLFEESELGDTRQSSNLLMPGISLNRSELDDPIYARRGWSIFTDLHGAQEGLLSNASFLQFRTVLRGVYPLQRRTRLLGRLEYGANWVKDFQELPASQRFFAGGDQSVRGYKYQSLGPTDADGNVIGGRYVTSMSLELERIIVGNWGAAAFFDMGGASDSAGPKMYQGVGLGLRYRAPVGSIQVDLAHPLDDPDNAVRLHIGVRVGL